MRSTNFRIVKVLVRAAHLSKNAPSFLSPKQVQLLEGEPLKIAHVELKKGLLDYIIVNYDLPNRVGIGPHSAHATE